MTLTALIAFLCMTAGVVLYFVSGGKKGGYASEQTARILGAYFVLTAGAAASLLQFAWTGGASAAHGLLFQGFYLGYIPLLLYTSSVYENGAKLRVFGRSVTPHFRRRRGARRRVRGRVRPLAAHVFLHPARSGGGDGLLRVDELCQQRIISDLSVSAGSPRGNLSSL